MIHFIEKLRKIRLPIFHSLSVYVDLGTAQTRFAIKDKGVVLRDATYLGYNTRFHEYIFFGLEAKTIVGKTPEVIHIVRPLVHGILSDFDAEVAYIHHINQQSIYPYLSQFKLLKPTLQALTPIPSLATEIEKKAVEEALVKAGYNRVRSIEKSIATAAGCGFDVFSHQPRFIIDLGAGLVELAIISGGGIVAEKTVRSGGDQMNKVIGNYLRLKHGVLLGDLTCEELKIQLLRFTGEDQSMTVRGKSLENGLPKSIRVKSSDVREALLMTMNQIIDGAKELVEMSPPEIADSVYNEGITLAGGMAGVEGIADFFSKELGVPVQIAERFADATIYGLIELDKHPENVYKLIGYR